MGHYDKRSTEFANQLARATERQFNTTGFKILPLKGIPNEQQQHGAMLKVVERAAKIDVDAGSLTRRYHDMATYKLKDGTWKAIVVNPQNMLYAGASAEEIQLFIPCNQKSPSRQREQS